MAADTRRTLCVTLALPEEAENPDLFNYLKAVRYLKSFPTWWHYPKSTWFIRTEKSCIQVRDELRMHLPEPSRVFVFRVGEDWAALGIQRSAVQRLDQYWE